MEFHGSNTALGSELVEITERRSADPLLEASEEQPLFPRGLGGLVPIRTLKASGVESLTYAFPFGEGVVVEEGEDADEAGAEAEGAGVSAAAEEAEAEFAMQDAADEDFSDIPLVQATEATKPVLDALLGAVDLVNGLLVRANDLTDYTFGQVCAVQVGVTERGVGFTRVEPFPADKDKAQSDVALTLHIETTDEMPGTTESFSAVVDYNDQGKAIRVAMLEYVGDGIVYRAAANIDEKSGELSIHKIERLDRTVHTERLLYKRGRDGRPERRNDGVAGRDERRGGFGRGDRGGRDRYDDRRGGYGRGGRGGYGRDEYGDRRGGFDRDDRRGFGGERGGHDDRRGDFGRDRYDRDDRSGFGGRGGFGGRDDREGRGGYSGDRGGYGRNGRGDRDSRDGYNGGRGGYGRDDSRGGFGGRSDRDQRGGYDRNDRGGFAGRSDRGERDGFAGRDNRDQRGGYGSRGSRDDSRGGFGGDRGGRGGYGLRDDCGGFNGDRGPRERY